MRRRRAIILAISFLLTSTLGLCTGCDLATSHLATFAAGYFFGRSSAMQFQVITTERVCYQNGVRVECP
jgi:hypothetical protein